MILYLLYTIRCIFSIKISLRFGDVFLLPVVILSDKPQSALLTRIARAIERNLSGGFVLREHVGRGEFVLDSGILVVKDLKTPSRKVRFGEGVVSVIESSCRSAVRFVGRHNLPAVCCGMSPRDTLIAESLDNGRGLLCLQRTVPTIYGEREPCELIALTDSDCDISSLLLTAGVMLAAGIDDRTEIRV